MTRGDDAGGYYHELFLRNKVFLCKKMIRTKVKGTKFKAASNPEAEPDFYSMPPVVTPPHSSDEEQSYESQAAASCGSKILNSRIQARLLDMKALPAMQLAELAPVLAHTANRPQEAQYLLRQMSKAFSAPISIQQVQSQGTNADPVLDEAVDELFLGEQDPNLVEFIQEWDPTFNSLQESLEDDINLGFMLEKVLEED